ncbi:MAG: hypothetical protein KDJ69_14780 [Nitratireductor sp.]|nr:hypothetical protein [Nitratireductor sp.]
MRRAAAAMLALVMPVFAASDVLAEDGALRLSAPASLLETGLLKYLLPRFSLKTGTRTELVGESETAAIRLNNDKKGRLVFSGPENNWYLNAGSDSASAEKFEDWLIGEIGQRTLASFTIEGKQPFTPAAAQKVQKAATETTGDAVLGESLAERHCGRCHMVNEKTRMTTIGSTPSFALMRSFPDWDSRFEGFYALNPHPSFTIVAEVTGPFDETRPPPIAPLELSLEDIEAILAFVRTIEPADLGSPLKVQ